MHISWTNHDFFDRKENIPAKEKNKRQPKVFKCLIILFFLKKIDHFHDIC